VHAHPRYGRTQVEPPHDYLPLVSCYVGLDPYHASILVQFDVWVGLLVVLLKYAFWKVHFSVFLDLCPQNIQVPKLMEYVSVKSYLLSFGVCLYNFCVKLAGENMS
jgi:hypothetical protein